MSSAYSSPLFMLPTHTPQISSYSCPCICHLYEFPASCWDKNINIVIHHSVSLVFLIISNKEILIQNHLWTPFPPPPPDTHEYSFDLEQTYFCQVCTDVTLLCLQFSCPCYCFTFDVTLKGKCHLVLHTSIIPHIILRVIAKCLAHVNKISMACAPPAFWLHFPSTLTFS